MATTLGSRGSQDDPRHRDEDQGEEGDRDDEGRSAKVSAAIHHLGGADWKLSLIHI